MTTISINGIEDISRAAKEFLKATEGNKIIAFYGSMGAGKTTFITALCNELGVEDVVNSPTFTIVNEYMTGKGSPIFHFDFYRINKLSEAEDIGLYEYFDSGELCFIEWPELIEPLLPEDTLRVEITAIDEFNRIIRF